MPATKLAAKFNAQARAQAAMNHITRNIRIHMAQEDIRSLKDLSKKAGVALETIYDRTARGHYWKFNELFAISEALHCSVVDLMEGIEQ